MFKWLLSAASSPAADYQTDLNQPRWAECWWDGKKWGQKAK